jgi:hypothetical protein
MDLLLVNMSHLLAKLRQRQAWHQICLESEAETAKLKMLAEQLVSMGSGRQPSEAAAAVP